MIASTSEFFYLDFFILKQQCAKIAVLFAVAIAHLSSSSQRYCIHSHDHPEQH
jgi:hypothetical protein